MRTNLKTIFLAIAILVGSLDAQYRPDARESKDEYRQLSKTAAPIDRAQNVISINQLGQVVTNMGQWHPYTGVFPRGRWPITTNHDQIYKMSFFIGIPYNVANARGNGTKEWDPLSGNHNPITGKIAISTDKTTWPLNNSDQAYWPVRTTDGRDSIVSQQDTYCQYNDNTNARPEKLNIQVTQTSYAWSTSKDQDYIIWKLEIYNNTSTPKDSLYFGLYYDYDAGGITNEYDNDYYVFDQEKQLTYVVGPTGTTGWEPGSKPFLLGLKFLETPMVDSRGWVVNQNGTRMGITDWHYSGVYSSAWGDNPTDDIIFFDWVSSNQRLRNNASRPNLFHGTNRRIDDWRLQDLVNGTQPGGDGVDGVASSGPYHMEPFQKMTFIFAQVAQQTESQLYQVADRANQIYNNGLQLVPPSKPTLTFTAYDNSVTLKWGNDKEFSYKDLRTGKSAVKEYRIYKTKDPNREIWGNPVAVIKRDSTKNTIISDLYQWQDNIDIKNYFYYSYAVTVYDVDGLESGKALLPADKTAEENVVEARPVSSPRSSLGDIKVVPNPYIISATWERKRLGDPKLGEPIRDIAFTNLPAQCTINVYTIDGNLVKTIEHSNGTGTEFWDLRSFSNQLIASGIYVYHVKSDAGEKVSKFAVVR
ncbi:MAG: T9SS type A sorting domain-containing protein [Ignavibacteriales bacterium]|nr:T9SS type A sorting domain-containing protein [Ignavibacteriales bacterium]